MSRFTNDLIWQWALIHSVPPKPPLELGQGNENMSDAFTWSLFWSRFFFLFFFFLKDTAERHDTTDWKLINESVILWIPFYSLTFKDLFRNYQQQICEKRFLISPKWGWVRSVSIFSADSRSLSEDDKGGKKKYNPIHPNPPKSPIVI